MKRSDTPAQNTPSGTHTPSDAHQGNDATRKRTRHNDPGRRQRIIDACLDVIAERGVNGVSHRIVAAAAQVPLGSMTYHFDGINDLLFQAFSHYMRQAGRRFRSRLDAAADPKTACDAIVTTIVEDLLGSRRDAVINLELFAIAARDPSFRRITTQWMANSHEALCMHFDERTAYLLDDLIDGITVQRALAWPTPSPEETRAEAYEAVSRILTGNGRLD